MNSFDNIKFLVNREVHRQNEICLWSKAYGYNKIDFATVSSDLEDEPPDRKYIIPCLSLVILFVQEN